MSEDPVSDAVRIDLRGQECPVPTTRTVALLRGAGAPEALVVVLDDAICAADIPYHARRFGYDARTDVTAGAEWTITLTRATEGVPPGGSGVPQKGSETRR